MSCRFACRCGRLQGEMATQRTVNHGVCYCESCQAFAHYLDCADAVLDAQGGTEVVQAVPSSLRFTQGLEHLSCMRLTPDGLLRWYASCCNTPVCNTPADYRISFTGVIHLVLRAGAPDLDATFGPVRVRGFRKFAKGGSPPPSKAMVRTVLRFIGSITQARITGRYRDTPFFDGESGQPSATPGVLPASEFEALMAKVRSARPEPAAPRQ